MPASTGRLHVNLNMHAVDALEKERAAQGLSITEGVHRAILLWRTIGEARRHGQKLYFVTEKDGKIQTQEVIIL